MTKNIPHLVVMLTHNDYTVSNAAEIYKSCRNTKARFWGMKECPLPLEEMKQIFAAMKEDGKITALEVVGYSEEEGLRGARMARECGCDILMGTTYSAAIADFCKLNNLKYMPFVGKITGRPSVLTGSVDEIVDEARSIAADGAAGIDILAYRHEKHPVELIRHLVSETDVPICVAGSIDSYDRLDEVKHLAPWAFTIGSAFFNKKFGESFAEQIDKVIDYLYRPEPAM